MCGPFRIGQETSYLLRHEYTYVRRALNDGAIRFLADIKCRGKNLNATQLDDDFRISTLLLKKSVGSSYRRKGGRARTSTASVTSALTVTVKSSPALGGSGDTAMDSSCIGSVGRP